MLNCILDLALFIADGEKMQDDLLIHLPVKWQRNIPLNLLTAVLIHFLCIFLAAYAYALTRKGIRPELVLRFANTFLVGRKEYRRAFLYLLNLLCCLRRILCSDAHGITLRTRGTFPNGRHIRLRFFCSNNPGGHFLHFSRFCKNLV